MNLMSNDEVDGRQFISSFSGHQLSASQPEFTNGPSTSSRGNDNTTINNYEHSEILVKREYNPPGEAEEEGGAFTCRRCGKSEYRNGEFATIKLGDIFTHISQFSSVSSNSDRFCSHCLKHNGGGAEVHGASGHTSVNNNNDVIKNFPIISGSSSTILNPNNSSSSTMHHHLLNENSDLSQMRGAVIGSVGASTGKLALHHHIVSSENFEGSLDSNGLLSSQLNHNQIYCVDNNEAIIHHQVTGDNPSHSISNVHNNDSMFLNIVSSDECLDKKKIAHSMLTTSQTLNLNENPNNNDIKSSHLPGLVVHSEIGSTTSNGPPFQIHVATSLTAREEDTNNRSPNKLDVLAHTSLLNKKPPMDNLLPRVPCDLCKKTFKNAKMASIHLKRVHEKVNRFVCEICGVSFSYRGSLDSHLSSHNPPEITHDCPTCGQQFKEKSNLNKHIRYHSDNPKKFLCEHCPSGFSKKVNLRYHIKRKHPEVAMNNNISASPSTIGYSPMVKVTGDSIGTSSPPSTVADAPGIKASINGKEKPQGNFKCEQCGRGFLFKNNLKAHLRTHTRDKKYTCELCQKSFIYKESLKNHMLLHSNELPYLCDICGKKFRDRSNRRKHVKNVHKYMFVNGDINNPIRPTTGIAQLGTSNPSSSAPTITGQSAPTKSKRRRAKKAGAPESTSSAVVPPNEENFRNIQKAPRAKKSKTSVESNVAIPPLTNVNNAKSVIVSASSTGVEGSTSTLMIDRKIIMSPSPKNASSSAPVSPLEYILPNTNPPNVLPVSVRVPLAGPSGQFSHGSVNRNIIVKASSTISSQSLIPSEMYAAERGPPMQNVIVYPKSKGQPEHPVPQYHHHHLQYSPLSTMTSSSATAVSQAMHRSQKHTIQQYYSTDKQHSEGQILRGYESSSVVHANYLDSFNSTLESLHHHDQSRSPPLNQNQRPERTTSGNGCYQYVLSSTNAESTGQVVPETSEDIKLFVIPSQSGENVNPPPPQYSTIYSDDPYHPRPHSHPQQQHYWVTNLEPSGPGSPYERIAASSSAGPHVEVEPIPIGSSPSYGNSHPITAASNVLNAPSYGQPHASETILDPSAHGSNFLYKDLSQFDFSYL